MSMAAKHAMNKRRRMFDGGDVSPTPTSTATIDQDKAKAAAGSMKKAFNFAKGGDVDCHACKGGVCMEHGGLVGDGMVDNIMRKRMSKGGEVANDTPPIADSEPADYDVLAEDDDLHFSYTGANSGDRLGNERTEQDDRDIVSRIMRSRAKKDRMPRPA